MSLDAYGWDERFQQSFDALEREDCYPARIFRAHADFFRVHGHDFECEAKLSGRIRHDAASAEELPTVGDWVAVSRADLEMGRIEACLERRSALRRKVAGRRTEAQVVAANVNRVLIVMAMDGDFNLRRLERYLTAVRESGAEPAIVLNKQDLCDDVTAKVELTTAVAVDVPLVTTSCKVEGGVDPLLELLPAQETAVLVGSSGVGKSTLINRLLGEARQATGAVREGDDRGRHTTTHRELFVVPNGALLIDSPGIRELQLWADTSSLQEAFDDVDALAVECRFRDCRHEREAGCAVIAASEDGRLDPARLESYRELQKELQYLELRQSESAQRVQRKKWRSVQKEYRRFTKNRGR